MCCGNLKGLIYPLVGIAVVRVLAFLCNKPNPPVMKFCYFLPFLLFACSVGIFSAQNSLYLSVASEPSLDDPDTYFPNGSGFAVYGAFNTYFAGAEKGGHIRSILLMDAPDSASDRVQIIAESITKGTIEVKNLAGQIIAEKILDGKATFLNLHEIKPDLFYIHIYSSGLELKTYKIIRKK